MKRRIVIVTGTRADWGKWRPVYDRLRGAPDFECHVAATGQHLDPRYGLTLVEVQREVPSERLWPFGNEAGNALDQLANTTRAVRGIMEATEPDMVLVHGDRMEALGAAVSATLCGVLVCHVEGGELSGNIDESTRHAVSKYAHLHMVSNPDAKERLLGMGEDPASVHVTGSPEVDAMVGELPELDVVQTYYAIPWSEYGVLCYHPESGISDRQQYVRTCEVIRAADESELPWVVLEPNCDPGSHAVREAMGGMDGKSWRRIPTMRPVHYLRLLKEAQVVLGNSSSGVREAPVFGTPSVSVGGRQAGRVQAECVVYTEPSVAEIRQALRTRAGKRYEPAFPFGEPGATDRMVAILRGGETWRTNLQKRWVA